MPGFAAWKTVFKSSLMRGIPLSKTSNFLVSRLALVHVEGKVQLTIKDTMISTKSMRI